MGATLSRFAEDGRTAKVLLALRAVIIGYACRRLRVRSAGDVERCTPLWLGSPDRRP